MTTKSKKPKKPKPGSMTGSIAANLHEGSRSEYLAQFVFSSFGTAIPVPHQEDAGLDLYCTLLERDGQRAWPRAHYSVQVKSTMSPWVFDSPESARWIIEHPLPIFLCIVEKAEARIIVYHTTPRFAVWALPTHPKRLELIPGIKVNAQTVEWTTGNTFTLSAPILNFTIKEILESDFRAHVAKVLTFWIDYDVENLIRFRTGIQYFWVPADYTTNTTDFAGWTRQGGHFREDSLQLARKRLKELLGLIATDCFHKKDMVNAAIYAMALRQLSPKGYSAPTGPNDPGDPHDVRLQAELNRLLGMEPPKYVFQGCDSLLKMLKDELARHGIVDLALPPSMEDYDVKLCAPDDLSKTELVACLAIIKAGGAVAVNLEKLESVKQLAVARKGDQIVGVGAIKQVREGYASDKARKSKVSFSSDTPELGYVAVDAKHQGNHLSDEIVASLLSKQQGSLFATTSNERMKKTLARAGFERKGREWKGRKGQLSLWIKESLADTSSNTAPA
jgi:hypothetical protein